MGFSGKSSAIAAGALLVALPFLTRAEDLPPDVLLVARALQANRKLLRGLPQYTCLETISRSQAAAHGRKSQKQDVVQLDVGVGSHEEIYSWPGDATFSSKNLFALVGHGLLANGLFQSFAANLFIQDAGIVKAAGEGVIDGKKAFRFTFVLPTLHSTWHIDWLGAQGSLNEEGEFWVDQADLTLLRLDVTARDIPITVPLRSLTITIRYRLLLVGEERALIPETAALNAVESSGILHQEAIGFSHCRAFEAQSGLAAGNSAAGDLTDTVSRYEAQREVLPAGLILPIILETAVRAENTMIGDRVSAVLEGTVKTPTHEVIPQGAVLKGRVRQFERLDDPPNTFMFGLEFDELTWPGHTAAFFAKMFSLQAMPGVESDLASQRFETRTIGSLASSSTTTEYTRPIPIPGVAAFFLRGVNPSLPKGFRMSWRTEDLARR